MTFSIREVIDEMKVLHGAKHHPDYYSNKAICAGALQIFEKSGCSKKLSGDRPLTESQLEKLAVYLGLEALGIKAFNMESREAFLSELDRLGILIGNGNPIELLRQHLFTIASNSDASLSFYSPSSRPKTMNGFELLPPAETELQWFEKGGSTQFQFVRPSIDKHLNRFILLNEHISSHSCNVITPTMLDADKPIAAKTHMYPESGKIVVHKDRPSGIFRLYGIATTDAVAHTLLAELDRIREATCGLRSPKELDKNYGQLYIDFPAASAIFDSLQQQACDCATRDYQII